MRQPSTLKPPVGNHSPWCSPTRCTFHGEAAWHEDDPCHLRTDDFHIKTSLYRSDYGDGTTCAQIAIDITDWTERTAMRSNTYLTVEQARRLRDMLNVHLMRAAGLEGGTPPVDASFEAVITAVMDYLLGEGMVLPRARREEERRDVVAGALGVALRTWMGGEQA